MSQKRRATITQLIKNTISDFKKSFSVYLGFEAIYKGLTSFVFIPFIMFILNYFIYNTGVEAITNNQIVSFGMSVQGLICISILGITSFFIIFIEQGGLIIISEEAYFNRKISTITSFFTAIRSIPKIMSVSFLQILLYFLLIIPYSGLKVRGSFITSIEIPKFIEDTLIKTKGGIALLIIISIIIYFFLVRWIFALHCAVLEGKNFTKALKYSKRLVKGSFFRILRILALWHGFLAFIGLIGGGLYILIIFIAVSIMETDSFMIIYVISLINILSGIVTVCVSLFIAPLNTILITQLYYEQIEENQCIAANAVMINENNSEINWEKLIYKHKKKLIALSSIVVIICTGITTVYAQKDMLQFKTIEVTAHRGSSIRAPENTMSAILYAIEEGAHYVEIDVQETKDGKIILLHDKNLNRVAGVDRNIWDMTYTELQNLEVGSWHSEEFRNEKIPTLEEVMKVTKGKIKLNIEIKLNGHENGLIESIIKLIKEKEFIEDCVITSLDYNALLKVEELNPSVRTGYIIYMAFGDISSLNVDFYSIESSKITEKLIQNIHGKNKKVHVWTVNDEEDMEKFIQLGVDNIITDNSKRLVKLIEENSNMDNIDKFLSKVFY